MHNVFRLIPELDKHTVQKRASWSHAGLVTKMTIRQVSILRLWRHGNTESEFSLCDIPDRPLRASRTTHCRPGSVVSKIIVWGISFLFPLTLLSIVKSVVASLGCPLDHQAGWPCPARAASETAVFAIAERLTCCPLLFDPAQMPLNNAEASCKMRRVSASYGERHLTENGIESA
jgi:hypothetical protein